MTLENSMVIYAREDKDACLVIHMPDWEGFLAKTATKSPMSALVLANALVLGDDGRMSLPTDFLRQLAILVFREGYPFRQRGVLTRLNRHDIPTSFLKAFGIDNDSTFDEDGLILVHPIQEENAVQYITEACARFTHVGRDGKEDPFRDLSAQVMLRMSQDAPHMLPAAAIDMMDLHDVPDLFYEDMTRVDDPVSWILSNPDFIDKMILDFEPGPLYVWTGSYDFPCPNECGGTWRVFVVVAAKKTSDESFRAMTE